MTPNLGAHKETEPVLKRNNGIDSTLPIGVAAALRHVANPTGVTTKTISDEFRLDGKVALVTGGNRGLGLEMALVLAELGATVYAVDLSETPSKDFTACASYAKALFSDGAKGRDRMIYTRNDVTDQAKMRALCELIVKNEGRLDVCVTAAGTIDKSKSCLEITAEEFQRVMNVK